MGRTLTNNTSFAFAKEASLGVLPGTPTWKRTEPNTIPTFGATIDTVAREPISGERQRRKGTITDLESAVEIEADITLESMLDFLEAFVFARAANPTIIRHLQSGANFDALAADNDLPGALLAGYAHNALSAAIPQRTLVFARGFSNAVNNGLFEVDAAGTTTATPIVGGAQVDETPTEQANASLDVAGIRAPTSDLAITVTGTTATLTSAAAFNFTTLGLTLGQLIHVGGLTAGRQFSAGKGFARIKTIASTTLTLDKLSSTLATDPGTGDSVDVLYGRFFRNVPVGSTDYVERSYTFEGAFSNLADPGPGDEFEYSRGNEANQLTLNIPLTDKATATFAFVGLDTDAPTGTRKTNAATPVLPVATEAINTTSDIARLRVQKVDETGLSSFFKSLTVTINNNIGPEKTLGTLGSTFVDVGNLLVDVEAQVLFTSGAVLAAIRGNTTVTMDFILRNNDGAVAVDFPSMTLGGGGKEFPVNESILLNLTGRAFKDSVLGTSIGVSIFPTVPLS